MYKVDIPITYGKIDNYRQIYKTVKLPWLDHNRKPIGLLFGGQNLMAQENWNPRNNDNTGMQGFALT